MSTRSGGPAGPGSRSPAGTPVSQALVLPPEPPGGPIRAAVAAIDRVHGDGPLPTLAVRRLRLPSGFEGHYDPAPSPSIVVSERARDPSLTLLHEIGHFLDHHGLGQSTAFASAADPSLAGWRAAIRGSGAFATLEQMLRTTTDPTLRDAISYLTRWQELWARSYAQYIVVRDGDPRLVAELDARRQRLTGRVYIPRQWDDDDFIHIADAIDDVVRGLGWIR